MRSATLPRRESPKAVVTPPTVGELTFLELPVFDTRSQAFADYLAGTLATPPETIVRLVSPPFRKDGVWVDLAGDPQNADCKATACGCLYWFEGEVPPWPYHRVGPENIVWRKAPLDWRERQERDDWSTVAASEPQVAPWLRKEVA